MYKIKSLKQNIDVCVKIPVLAMLCIIFVMMLNYRVSAKEAYKKTQDETEQKYLDLFKPAKDDSDYLWDSDYTYIKGGNFTKLCDSKGYEKVFGYKKPTYDELARVIKKNRNIPKRFKRFVADVTADYLNKYPETDFSVFKKNLETLKIKECTADEIRLAAISYTALACYRTSENTIYVLKGINVEDKSSDDYIILSHELMHAARQIIYKDDREKIKVTFYDKTEFGYYIDETLNTYFMYELQGLNKKPTHYTISSNYMRVFLDCLGDSYTGSDYMNHSVNYLAKKMDEYMGDTQYAYHVLAQLESLNTNYYADYIETDYTNFDDLNNYTLRMYMKKNLKKSMSRAQADKLFSEFVKDITYNYENLTREHAELTEKTFKKEYEKILKEYKI